jgi:hypothetical protein
MHWNSCKIRTQLQCRPSLFILHAANKAYDTCQAGESKNTTGTFKLTVHMGPYVKLPSDGDATKTIDYSFTYLKTVT